MRKRILHVINSLAVGGAETLLANTLSPGGLQEQADNFLVYFQGESPLLDRIDKNVKVFCLNYSGLLSLPAALTRLRKFIRENRIDVVHTHLNPAGFYTHLACPADIPQVHTLHIAYSTDIETRPLKLFLERELYFKRQKTNMIFLSDFIREDFKRAVAYRGRSFVLNNFVSDRFFDAASGSRSYTGGPLKLIGIGRLEPHKNFEYLLEVFSLLKGKEISLDIYGGGDTAAYETRIRELGVRVSMKGQRLNLEEVLPEYHLFIMPSKNEGFPLSVFEAMAAGVPAMLSDIEPLTSIVHDNALYFPLNNAGTVAGMISDIFEGRTKINDIALKAKAYAESTVRRERYLSKLLSIYKEL